MSQEIKKSNIASGDAFAKRETVPESDSNAGVLFQVSSMAIAVFLLVCLAPLFVVVAITLKVRLGAGPIFYRGVRLGRNKREFVMYKFRTLPENAQSQIGSELFSNRFNMLTPLTNFLRETRLDELPQLVNVLKRDMDFFGPRPVRPEIYRDRCQMIPNYDLRFAVRPGLIGYSQLYTPHSAPKRIRAAIDNQFLGRKRELLEEVKLLGSSIAALTLRLGRRIKSSSRAFVNIRVRRAYSEKRQLERVALKNAVAIFTSPQGDEIGLPMLDINEKYFRVICDGELPKESRLIRLQITTFRKGHAKKKRAVCTGTIISRSVSDSSESDNVFIVEYLPFTPLNGYVISQYFLRQSIA